LNAITQFLVFVPPLAWLGRAERRDGERNPDQAIFVVFPAVFGRAPPSPAKGAGSRGRPKEASDMVVLKRE
jgi:hypothetical protein